jgi:hypothetical protein
MGRTRAGTAVGLLALPRPLLRDARRPAEQEDREGNGVEVRTGMPRRAGALQMIRSIIRHGIGLGDEVRSVRLVDLQKILNGAGTLRRVGSFPTPGRPWNERRPSSLQYGYLLFR